MVRIERLAPAESRPALGRESQFAVRGERLIAVDYYLEHEGVFYPKPLRSEPDGSVRVYPEAPGRYGLHAAWRSAHATNGWTRIEFQVTGAQGSTPQRITAEGETLLVPTPWDAQTLGAHERPAFRELHKLVARGATVYDIGANVGLFSARFSRLIGPRGWLYALEPNPICVYFLRANLELAGARNFTILPMAASSGRTDCSFSVNYGSSLIGVGSESVVAGKPGHEIRVDAESLDALILRLNLRRPDFIKLDVEGAEANAVAGMMETLERRRPRLMIELHGRDVALATLQTLNSLNYQWLLCSTGARYASTDALREALPEACVQVIGQP